MLTYRAPKLTEEIKELEEALAKIKEPDSIRANSSIGNKLFTLSSIVSYDFDKLIPLHSKSDYTLEHYLEVFDLLSEAGVQCSGDELANVNEGRIKQIVQRAQEHDPETFGQLPEKYKQLAA